MVPTDRQEACIHASEREGSEKRYKNTTPKRRRKKSEEKTHETQASSTLCTKACTRALKRLTNIHVTERAKGAKKKNSTKKENTKDT